MKFIVNIRLIDTGNSWAITPSPSFIWAAIAMNSDGTFIAAVPSNGYIYISSSGIIKTEYHQQHLNYINHIHSWE